MGLSPFSLIGDVLSAGTSIANNIMNMNAQKEANAQNEAFAREVNETNWNRQDTAIQRAVADAQTVGISPLAAIGQAAQSTSAMTANTQAPQFTLGQDAANLAALLTTQDTLDETKRRNLAEEKNTENSLAFEKDKFDKEVQLQNDRLDFEIQEAEKQHDEEKARQLEAQRQFNETMAETKFEFDENAKIKSQEFENEYFYDQQNKQYEAYTNLCSAYGIVPKIKYYTSEKDYEDQLNAFYTALNTNYHDIYKQDGNPISVSGSSSESSTTGVGGNASVAGTGAGLNISDSSSSAESYDFSQSLEAAFKAAMSSAYFPIYRPSRSKYSESTRPKNED